MHRWEPRHVANLLWGLARRGTRALRKALTDLGPGHACSLHTYDLLRASSAGCHCLNDMLSSAASFCHLHACYGLPCQLAVVDSTSERSSRVDHSQCTGQYTKTCSLYNCCKFFKPRAHRKKYQISVAAQEQRNVCNIHMISIMVLVLFFLANMKIMRRDQNGRKDLCIVKESIYANDERFSR